MEYQPIFIAGPDRSGTTLMFALLSSHPNISMVRRTNMFHYFYQRYGDLSNPENFERCFADLLRYDRTRNVNPNPDRIRQEFLAGELSYGRLFGLFHQHNAERLGKKRWGDKSLHMEHYADQLFTEYPNARIIHMSRDPRDRYASVKKRHNQNLSRVGAATGRWLYSMNRANRNLRRYPDNYMIVRFEDLVFKTEETVKKVCDFIGEEFASAMLTMDGASDYKQRGGNSSFEQINPGSVSTQPVGRYRQVLTTFELVYIQLFGGGMMKSLGYELETTKLTAKEWFAFLIQLPVTVARMLGWTALTFRMLKRGEKIPVRRLKNLDEQLALYRAELSE